MNTKPVHFRRVPLLKIREVDCYLVESRGRLFGESCRSLVIRLIGPDGEEGWGEGPSRWNRAELPSRQEALTALLVDRSAFDMEELSTLDVLRCAGLRSAVEMACWDLIGKRVGEPVCHLWGGRYRNYVPLAARLPMLESVQNLSAFARELADQGFHTLVLPATGGLEEDLSRVLSVREAAGERSRLYLDAAGQYSEPAAQDLCAGLEYQYLQGVIDVLDSKEVYAFASFARQTSVPIGLHRPLTTLVQVFSAVRSGAGAFLVLDPDELGGMTPVRKAAAVAEAAGIPCLLYEGGGVGIRLAALVHLNAAVGFLDQPCLACCYRKPEEWLSQGLEIVEGMAVLPEGPGWGIEMDMEKLEEWQIG